MTGDVCPPDHKHGENLTCTTKHACTCPDCRTAHRDYSFWHRHMVASGRTDLINSLVPATGTRRRIEALMSLGWSQSALSAHLGHSQGRISTWLQVATVRRSTHVLVAAAYEPLSVQRPTADTKAQRMSVNRTLALAKRRGYAGPFDWDDIDTDFGPRLSLVADVDVVDELAVQFALDGHQVKLTRKERHLAVTALNGRNYNDVEVAAMLRVSTKTIERDREDLGLPANRGTYEERFAAA